eukprot:6421351-Prorocentrum_lima.AAC.1
MGAQTPRNVFVKGPRPSPLWSRPAPLHGRTHSCYAMLPPTLTHTTMTALPTASATTPQQRLRPPRAL